MRTGPEVTQLNRSALHPPKELLLNGCLIYHEDDTGNRTFKPDRQLCSGLERRSWIMYCLHRPQHAVRAGPTRLCAHAHSGLQGLASCRPCPSAAVTVLPNSGVAGLEHDPRTKFGATFIWLRVGGNRGEEQKIIVSCLGFHPPQGLLA